MIFLRICLCYIFLKASLVLFIIIFRHYVVFSLNFASLIFITKFTSKEIFSIILLSDSPVTDKQIPSQRSKYNSLLLIAMYFSSETSVLVIKANAYRYPFFNFFLYFSIFLGFIPSSFSCISFEILFFLSYSIIF